MNTKSKTAYDDDDNPRFERVAKQNSRCETDFAKTRHFCNDRCMCNKRKRRRNIAFRRSQTRPSTSSFSSLKIPIVVNLPIRA